MEFKEAMIEYIQKYCKSVNITRMEFKEFQKLLNIITIKV